MENNSRKLSDIYFDLFEIMMTYNHKLWRTAALPLPLNHFAVMYYLFEKENTFATVTELAKHLSISKQQMSPIIDKLVKKEFIKKTCLSKDRRYNQISLSEKGREFLKEHQKSQRLIFMKCTTDLSNSDTKKFYESVQIVKKMMAKIFENKK
ncbi:MarR family transcriptional regulator [Megamonas hypermegale]|uniref:MarR family winged helix-turn-helix transcriptional regulator n=1 Tax=Megamonas hypermegale TaxID=158847 RepID=UPI000B39E33D|nr:MarR family transcriptional regulator [Megamonas hypermegale]OUO39342.1 MarR family transcriptional regulator [Megamonas hypermegale]